MKILFVNPYYKPYLGGIERVIEKLSREFQKSGHEVGVLTSFAKFPGRQMTGLPAKEEINKVTIFRRLFSPPTIPFISASPGAGFWGEFESVLNDFKPDVIQLMSDRWWPVNYQVWRKRGAAKVFYSLSFHDLNLSWPAKILKIPIRYFNHQLTNLVNKTIVITRLEAGKVQATYDTKPEQIVVIPWGVGQPVTFKKNSNITLQILAVGRISRHKGQDKLLQAFARGRAEFKVPVELVLAGSDEGLSDELRQEVRRLGLDQQVRLVGEVSDSKLEELYRAADIFALTPSYEAFGLVFLEAASYGLPIVTWDVGAIREVLGDEGLISPAGETSKIAANLIKLVNGQVLRQEWSKKSLELARRYSWAQTGAAFLQEYTR